MADERAYWFDLKLVSSTADVVLKISAALGIILGVSLHVFRANVVLDVEEGRENPFFQTELDVSALRDEHARVGRPLPLAVEVLVDRYNEDNERDLKDLRDSTGSDVPVSRLCGAWLATSEAVFGSGFCAGGGPGRPNERRLRYWGRTYERRLVAVNETGLDPLPPLGLPPEQLAQTLDLLHRSEFGAARVELTNTGRAVATDVRLHAPPGYSFVGNDGEEFALQPGRTAVRRLETERGERPQTIDRSIGVHWNTGKGFVPGGRDTVLAAVAVIALAIGYALLRDWRAFRRAVAARRAPPPEPLEPPVA